MSYYRNLVKDMDESQKLELVSIIIDSMKPASKQEQGDACIDSAEREQARPKVKPAKNTDEMTMEKMLEGYPYKRYTKAEMNAMLDEAEANFEAGRGIPDEEAWDDLEEELALEKQELEMAEAI